MSRHALALVSVVAVAALSGCAGESPDTLPIIPSPRNLDNAELILEPRDLAVTYKLQGASVSSPRVGFTQPENTVLTMTVAAGHAVRAGAVVGTYRPEPATLAELRKAAPNGTVARSQLRALRQRSGTLVAPLAGTLAPLDGQPTIAATGLDAVVTLTPLQVLRYQSLGFASSVSLETVFGQRTAPCQAAWITSQGGGRAQLHCRIPADVETTAGLPATITLRSEPLKNVLAVPAIYVGIDHAGRDYVVRVRRDGQWQDAPVVVGASDGVVRVLESGVRAGEVLKPLAEPSGD